MEYKLTISRDGKMNYRSLANLVREIREHREVEEITIRTREIFLNSSECNFPSFHVLDSLNRLPKFKSFELTILGKRFSPQDVLSKICSEKYYVNGPKLTE